MTSKEKILTVAASLGLALGLVLLLFVQLGTGSEQASPMLTAVASPISEAISDENCDKSCLDKELNVITTPKGGIKVGQHEVGKEHSFVPMNSRQTMTQTADLAAPIVHQLVISDGVPTTSEQAVTLDLSVTDPPPEPISGVSVVYFIEYEYVLSNGSWVPVRNSNWVHYTEGGLQDYPWSLTPTYGVRYMRVWAKDQASNISRDSSIGVINLLPSEQAATLSLGDVNFYRIYVEAGQTLTATLTAVSGDPDLYIWGPSGDVSYTNSPTEVERLAVAALETGTYQIEVHGYTETEYKLNFGTSHNRVANLPGVQSSSKAASTEPRLPLDSLPDSSAPPTNNLTATATPNLGVNISALMPNSGWNDGEVELELQGYGFTEPLTVTLGSTPLTVTEVLSDRILAIVPRGLGLGWYNITVNSPSYGSVSLSNAYEVLGGEGKSYSVYLPITVR